MDEDNKSKLVVALAYDRLGTFEFGCATEIFALARPELGVDWYRFAVCSEERGMLRSCAGMQFQAPHGLEILEQADIIIIPGWRDPDEAPSPALLARLRAAAARGARLCSICSGAFVLAWAGLLDGRRATTHWRLSDKLQRDFPAIEVASNVLYVDAGQILSSAGSAAGLDLMLHLVASDYGPAVARQVARRLILQPQREGAQPQHGGALAKDDERDRLGQLIAGLRRSLNQPHTLASLARQAAMSPRTLQRQFNESTGLSPYEWLLRERVSLAQQMLATPRATLAHICERAGFFSEESFRHHFRRVAGVSPSDYRRALRQRPPAQRQE